MPFSKCSLEERMISLPKKSADSYLRIKTLSQSYIYFNYWISRKVCVTNQKLDLFHKPAEVGVPPLSRRIQTQNGFDCFFFILSSHLHYHKLRKQSGPLITAVYPIFPPPKKPRKKSWHLQNTTVSQYFTSYNYGTMVHAIIPLASASVGLYYSLHCTGCQTQPSW